MCLVFIIQHQVFKLRFGGKTSSFGLLSDQVGVVGEAIGEFAHFVFDVLLYLLCEVFFNIFKVFFSFCCTLEFVSLSVSVSNLVKSSY
jgi:hypothetical protein